MLFSLIWKRCIVFQITISLHLQPGGASPFLGPTLASPTQQPKGKQDPNVYTFVHLAFQAALKSQARSEWVSIHTSCNETYRPLPLVKVYKFHFMSVSLKSLMCASPSTQRFISIGDARVRFLCSGKVIRAVSEKTYGKTSSRKLQKASKRDKHEKLKRTSGYEGLINFFKQFRQIHF